MTITNFNYTFGTTNGTYATGDKITDFLLGADDVTTVVFLGTTYPIGEAPLISQDRTNKTINFNGVITPANGDILTVNFVGLISYYSNSQG